MTRVPAASRALLAVCLFSTACGWRGPQIMTPVLVPSTAPAAETQPTAMRPIASAADDPFRRIDRMDWPGPNAFRSSSGAPGPAYWQQRADYSIAATLD